MPWLLLAAFLVSGPLPTQPEHCAVFTNPRTQALEYRCTRGRQDRLDVLPLLCAMMPEKCTPVRGETPRRPHDN